MHEQPRKAMIQIVKELEFYAMELYGMLSALKIKKQEFQKFIEDYNIDITVVTETCLALTDTLHLLNFDIIRRNRTSEDGKVPRGEVMIAIHKKIPVEDITQPETTNNEAVIIKTKILSLTINSCSSSSPGYLDSITNKNKILRHERRL